MTSASNQDIPRKVPASQGFKWVIEGFRLYRKNPLLLSAAFGLLFGVVMALNLIPGIGGALSGIVSPLMAAGFLAAFRALDNGKELELPYFRAGVPTPIPSGPTLPLIALGVVQLLGTFAIGLVMFSMGFDPEAIMAAAQNSKTSPAELQALTNQALPTALTGLVLFTPLIMATWFAPALILFGGARPATALGVSLKAVIKNWAALTVNGLTLLGLLLILSLVLVFLGTLGLMVVLPVLLLVVPPVLQGSLYASYQAIFAVWADEPSANHAADNLA